MKKFIMVLDTETVSIDKRFVYDIGYIVAKLENGKYVPIEKNQVIVKNVYDNRELFETAYYANKRKKYTTMLRLKRAEKMKIGYITQKLAYVLKRYGIENVFAYNSPFDKQVFKFNTEYYKLQNPFENSNWVDIQAIANTFIHQDIKYMEFVKENKMINESGYIKTNAEATYAFLTNNPEYVEEHTSLQDCEIELDILNECIKRGYDMTGDYKQKFITAQDTMQVLRIISNGKTYEFKYRTKRKTKQGIVLKG